MDWVFCFDERSSSWFANMIKVAVVSAESHTSLKPVCLFDGETETPVIPWLRKRGVRVVKTSVPFRDELFAKTTIAANAGTPYKPSQAAGAYLRLCAIDHCEGESCLYTDCDVMFLGDPEELLPKTAFIGASPELVSGAKGYEPARAFNSGVMLFDRAGFLARRADVIAHAREQNFYSRRTSSFDQTILNEALKADWSPLDARLNWRPFQGIGEDVRIVHFHGPKPHRVARILAGDGDPADIKAFMPLIEPEIDAYRHYLALYQKYLSAA